MADHSFAVRLYPKQDKAKKDGTVPIYAKLWLDKQKTEITTGRYIQPTCWDDKAQRVVRDENADDLNRYLSTFKGKLENAYSQLYTAGEEITLDAIRARVLGEPTRRQKGFIEVMEEHNKHFLSLVGTKYSQGSYKNYKSTLKYLKEFIPEHYKKADVPLPQVNYQFLQAYYHFLMTKKECKTNGANKQVQRVKKVMNYAMKHEYISTNPTATFSIKNTPVSKVILTLEEVGRIAALSLQRPTLKMVRDVFLFQCYTGLAYCDVKELKQSHIVAGDDGQQWIKKEREKSHITFSVPLLSPAKVLLEEYVSQREGVAIFPVLTNQKMNLNLKLIQELAGVAKTLTTHIARHTFATTITLKHKVPIETVSKMMGHTKLSTTQIYAKVLDDKIREDMQGLENIFTSTKANKVEDFNSLTQYIFSSIAA